MIIAQPAPLLSDPSDASFANVKLLLGFNGPNNSITTGFADESSAAHGTLINGSVSLAKCSTVKRKFGVASLRQAVQGVWLADHADWNLSNGLFTIEMFIRPDVAASGTPQFLIGQWSAAPTLGWEFYIDASGHLAWNVSTTGSNNLFDITGSNVLTSAAWQHVCIDFNGTKYRIYHEGVMVGSSTTLRTINNSTNTLGIGSSSSSGNFWYTGYMDELRFTPGMARYGSDGGLVVPTQPFGRHT